MMFFSKIYFVFLLLFIYFVNNTYSTDTATTTDGSLSSSGSVGDGTTTIAAAAATVDVSNSSSTTTVVSISERSTQVPTTSGATTDSSSGGTVTISERISSTQVPRTSGATTDISSSGAVSAAAFMMTSESSATMSSTDVPTSEPTTTSTTTTPTTTTTERVYQLTLTSLTYTQTQPEQRIITLEWNTDLQSNQIKIYYFECTGLSELVNETLNYSDKRNVSLKIPNDSPGRIASCFMRINYTATTNGGTLQLQTQPQNVSISLDKAKGLKLSSTTPNVLLVEWDRPMGVYDSLNIDCSASEDAASGNFDATKVNVTNTVQSRIASSSTFSDIIAGLRYKCSITTVKSGFTSVFSDTQFVYITPNRLEVITTSFLNQSNELSMKIKRPSGYFTQVDVLINSTRYQRVLNYSNTKDTIIIKFDKIGSVVLQIEFNTRRHNNTDQLQVDVSSAVYTYQTPIIRIRTSNISLISTSKFEYSWSLNQPSSSIPTVAGAITYNVTALLAQTLTITVGGVQRATCSALTNTKCEINMAEISPLSVYEFKIENSATKLTNDSQVLVLESFIKSYQHLPDFKLIDFKKVIIDGLSFKCNITFSLDQGAAGVGNVKWVGYSVYVNEVSVLSDIVGVSKECLNGTCILPTKNLDANKSYKVKLVLISDLFNSTIRESTTTCKTDASPPFYNTSSGSSVVSGGLKANITISEAAIQFPQLYFDESSGKINSYWVYLILDVDPAQLIVNLASKAYLKELIEYKNNRCNASQNPNLHCPIDLRERVYDKTKVIYIAGVPESTLISDYFNYSVEANRNYTLFMIYSIKRVQKRDTPSVVVADGTMQNLVEASDIYFTSLVYSNLLTPRAMTKKPPNDMESWTIAIICIAIVILLLVIVIIGVVIYRNRQEKTARKVHKRKRSKSPTSASFQFSKHMGSKKNSTNRHSDYEMPFIEPADIRRNDMERVWLFKHANCDLKFEDEYKNLPDFRDLKTTDACDDLKNNGKNRFLDIKPFDDSRVVLENNLWETGDNCDYINANFIQGYSHKKKFIATQGPLKATLGDFWHMVWQYRVHAIVMLTNIIEKGMDRCAQYWPEQYNVSYQYGDMEVTMRESIKIGDYIKRIFEVRSLADVSGPSSNVTANGTIKKGSVKEPKMLIVTQYHYPEWPDRDTPTTDAMSLLHLIRDLNKNHPAHQYPIVVHCSAGVGRTGTYITLDAMYEQLNKEGKFNSFQFIKKIREQRQYLVQTPKQYVFIHEALYEYCIYGFTDVEASKLVTHYKHLKEVPSGHSKSKLQLEFEKLSTAYSHQSQSKEACNYMNKARNRDLSVVCYDENRVRLSSLHGSAYINATKIIGYEGQNTFIVTQDPMQNTIFEFWKMISEYNCQLIVCLNRDYLREDVQSLYFPLDEEKTKVFEHEDLKFCISLIENDNDDPLTDNIEHNSIQKIEYEVIESKHSNTHKFKVTQFIFNEHWAEDDSPSNCSTFLDLIGQVQKLYSRLDKSPIVVHANGGGSNCSVFCALSILIDQFKNDQYVDVCRTVKKLRTQRSHTIESFEQYNFIYECLVEFVGVFGLLSCQSTSFDRFSTSSSSNRASSIGALPSQQNQSNEAVNM